MMRPIRPSSLTTTWFTWARSPPVWMIIVRSHDSESMKTTSATKLEPETAGA